MPHAGHLVLFGYLCLSEAGAIAMFTGDLLGTTFLESLGLI